MKPLKQDSKLTNLIETHGEIELFYSTNLYQQLVCMIIEQQVSTASARATQQRMFNKFRVEPEEILEADREELKSVGLSRQKVDYVKNAAGKFQEDGLNREKFGEMTDEEVIDELTEIKGIGEWTAEMFLIFGLGRKDVFSTGDLVLRNAMTDLYGIEDRQKMRDKAEDWKPHRSIAALYLWKHKESMD
jgi:DNA-3-methyladenine glycosylase II